MMPCKKCLENNWTVKTTDNIVHGTCNQCGYEVQFQSMVRQPFNAFVVGQPCRKCKAPLAIRKSKMRPSKLTKNYYYTAYFWCWKCNTMYLDDKFKVYNNPQVQNKSDSDRVHFRFE